jgi:hypothetical protein
MPAGLKGSEVGKLRLGFGKLRLGFGKLKLGHGELDELETIERIGDLETEGSDIILKQVEVVEFCQHAQS